MRKAFKILTQVTTGIASVLTLTTGRLMAAAVDFGSSEDPAMEGAEVAKPTGAPTELLGDAGVFTRITNTVLYAVGIISVIMLVYGGLRYVLSGGDNKKVTDAKNTILYAIIGLIISLLSYAIVNFVINAVTGQSQPAPVQG